MRSNEVRVLFYVVLNYCLIGVVSAAYLLIPGAGAVLMVVGTWTCGIAAIVVLAVTHEPAAIRMYFRRLLRVRVPGPAWALVLTYPSIIALSIVAYFLFTPGARVPANPPIFQSLSFLPVMLFGAAVSEEIGWRGLALSELNRSFPSLVSSIIIGALWTIDHVPLWFAPELGYAAIPFGAFIVDVVSMSVTLSFLVQYSGGSLFVVWLSHFLMNQGLALVPALGIDPDPFFYYYAGGQLLFAATVILATRGRLGEAHAAKRAAPSVVPGTH